MKIIVEKFVKTVYGEKHSFTELTYIAGSHWNCLIEPTTYVTEIKETYFEIYIYQESCPLAFPLKNISVCQSVLKYLPLYGKLCNSYTMACPPVRGDNQRAVASGLSYAQVDKQGISILYHLHQCRPCKSRDISC